MNGNIWVQLQHCLDVLQWVLLHCYTLAAGTTWAEGGLDFISLNGKRLETVLVDGVKTKETNLEDTLEISIGHDWSWHGESLFVV